MDPIKTDEFYREVLKMQRDLRLILVATCAWPVLTIGFAAFDLMPVGVAWLSCICAFLAFLAVAFGRFDVTDWWFLWRGPILHVAIADPVRYAENIGWLHENYNSQIKVLSAGIIKFRKAHLAVLFKMM